jgi:hypothetical protein
MATIKKSVKKSVKKANFGCGPGGCGTGTDRAERRANRQAKREAGERIDQKIMRGLGLATLEGQSNRQSARSQRINDRRDARQQRAEERRASGGMGGGMFNPYKTGGKVKKSKTGTKIKNTKVKKYQNSGDPLKASFGPYSIAMDTSGFSAGAKRFPVTETQSLPGGKQKVGKFATNRKGAKSMIEKTQGNKEKLTLPIRRASSVKKNKSGGKTSKRK